MKCADVCSYCVQAYPIIFSLLLKTLPKREFFSAFPFPKNGVVLQH
jgi:hypothetical protein